MSEDEFLNYLIFRNSCTNSTNFSYGQIMYGNAYKG